MREAADYTSAVMAYQAALSTEIHPLRVEIGARKRPFRGGISTLSFGRVKLAQSYANSSCICYWDRGSKTGASAFYRIHIQEQGETRYRFSHGEVHCPPNSVLLIEGDSEIAAEQPAEAQGVHVMLPRSMLEAQMRSNGLECFKSVSTNTGSARILREIVRELLARGTNLTTMDEAAFMSSLVWMIGAVFAADNDSLQETSALSFQFKRIAKSIERNHSDPDYNISSASAELGISHRYIQVALRQFGMSFSSMLLRRRLAASRDLLAHLPVKCNPVTEAAFSSGFNDLSHFSRSFSREYGLSPKAYRDRISKTKD